MWSSQEPSAAPPSRRLRWLTPVWSTKGGCACLHTDDKHYLLAVTVPPRTVATVCVPVGDSTVAGPAVLTLNGVPVEDAEISVLEAAGGRRRLCVPALRNDTRLAEHVVVRQYQS